MPHLGKYVFVLLELKEVRLMVRHEYCIYCLDIEEICLKNKRYTVPELVIVRKVCLWRLSQKETRLLTGIGLDGHWELRFQYFIPVTVVAKDWGKPHNEELNDLYSSPNIVLVMKSRRMRRAGHVTHMGARSGVYRVLVGKPEV